MRNCIINARALYVVCCFYKLMHVYVPQVLEPISSGIQTIGPDGCLFTNRLLAQWAYWFRDVGISYTLPPLNCMNICKCKPYFQISIHSLAMLVVIHPWTHVECNLSAIRNTGWTAPILVVGSKPFTDLCDPWFPLCMKIGTVHRLVSEDHCRLSEYQYELHIHMEENDIMFSYHNREYVYDSSAFADLHGYSKESYSHSMDGCLDSQKFIDIWTRGQNRTQKQFAIQEPVQDVLPWFSEACDAKKRITAIPTVGCGSIKYRSKLEAQWSYVIDRMIQPLSCDYEPAEWDHYLKPGYIPDFIMNLGYSHSTGQKLCMMVEVKPHEKYIDAALEKARSAGWNGPILMAIGANRHRNPSMNRFTTCFYLGRVYIHIGNEVALDMHLHYSATGKISWTLSNDTNIFNLSSVTNTGGLLAKPLEDNHISCSRKQVDMLESEWHLCRQFANSVYTVKS